MFMTFVNFLIFSNIILSQAQDFSKVHVLDQKNLSQAKSCLILDVRDCGDPIQLFCGGRVTAEIMGCTTFFRNKTAEQHSVAISTLTAFMHREKFEVDQSLKFLIWKNGKVPLITFIKN